MARRRAIGVIRVSRVGDREGERFASPEEQGKRIEEECRRLDLELLDVWPELDVSGRSPLAKRPGLSRAVAEIEAGRADVVVVAYFDRLVRSLRVQEEVVSRAEAAGGAVLAADFGQVTNASAATWLSSTMLGMVAEYVSRTTAERTAGAQQRAVEQGRPPFSLIPGLKRTETGQVVIDDITAPAVRRAFEMRAEGASIQTIRLFLRGLGIERSFHGVTCLLKSSMAVGEIVYRGHRGAVPALIERELWNRVQSMVVPRGRPGKSQRLLARLGVLLCKNCEGRMVVTSKRGETWAYRCAGHSLCTARATINADPLEALVVEHVKRLGAEYRGRASSQSNATKLRAVATRDQLALDRAIEAFTGLEAEPAAVAKIRELTAARDASQAAADRAARDATALEISIGQDWDRLCHEERRSLVRALFKCITVAPGRGLDRVNVVPAAALFQ